MIVTYLFSAVLAFSPSCTKGQPCGNSCISWSKTCHIDAPAPRQAQAPLFKSAPNPHKALPRWFWLAKSQGKPAEYIRVRGIAPWMPMEVHEFPENELDTPTEE